MTSSLKEDLAILIGKYGMRDIHEALMNRISVEYSYIKKIMENKVEAKVEAKVEENIIEVKEKKFKDSKEQKIWQKEQEEKKRKENLVKGINPKDLLTKENLKKWIEEEGRTYSYIAREYTGCKDSEVSSAAKLYNIENTHKNVMITAKK